MKKIILEVKDLEISFKNKKEIINIIRGINLRVYESQIVGMVGESGSGKSVATKSLLNLNGNNVIVDAEKMEILGQNLDGISNKEWLQIRGKKIAYIPQEPMASLNPTRTIKRQLWDTLEVNRPEFNTKEKRNQYIIETLEFFGIRDAKDKIEQYPHTLSGGMKQRMVIASAVMCKPDLIIADEPTTALDTVVQASVLNLFEKIREKHKVSIIFISHDIGVIAKLCDYIYIMYAGRVLEKGTRKDIFTNPKHPYTWALLASIPENTSEKELYAIPGSPPNMKFLPPGCPFAQRNEFALEIDFVQETPLLKISETHFAATWLLHPDSPKVKIPKATQEKIKIFKKVFK